MLRQKQIEFMEAMCILIPEQFPPKDMGGGGGGGGGGGLSQINCDFFITQPNSRFSDKYVFHANNGTVWP